MTTKTKTATAPAEEKRKAAEERHKARVAAIAAHGFSPLESDILATGIAGDAKLETDKERLKKLKAGLRDTVLRLADECQWSSGDLSSGGRGGKEYPVGRHYRALCDAVAHLTLAKRDLALYQSGDGKRGSDAAKIRNRVAGTARRFQTILAPAAPATLDEQLRDMLANARTKVLNAQKADTDVRERQLSELAGHDMAWLSLLDAAIAASPKK